ncbi:MAG: hypothetical protein J0647_09735 [Campylobacteraceae bacterium]|nr:hypothetical protein [Campylobacteraceae bacterium]
MQEIFRNYGTIIIFLHILSAVIWVGGMIAIRFAVHPSLQSIDEPKIRLGKTLQIVGRLFNIVMPFIIISALCGIIILKGVGYSGVLIHLKEAIWTVMTLNFAYMYIKRAKAQKFFNNGDLAKAKEMVKLLPTILLPINIVLGLMAILAGVVLRGL